MNRRFLAPFFLLVGLVLASFLPPPGALGQAASGCMVNDHSDPTGDLAVTPTGNPGEDVTQFNRVDIIGLCVSETATNVEFRLTLREAPGAGLALQTFVYTVHWKVGATDHTFERMISTSTADEYDGGAPPAGASVAAEGPTLKFSVPKTVLGLGTGGNLSSLFADTQGRTLDPNAVVNQATDRAPDGQAVLFPPSNPYIVGSRAPDSLDSDSDGSPDRYEIANRTDPFRIDSDSDGLLDGPNKILTPGSPEAVNLTRAQIAIVNETTDVVTFGGEGSFGTNATHPDTDGDGLLDGGNISLPNGDANVTYLQGFNLTADESNATHALFLGELGFGTDPMSLDTDEDGLWDKTEVTGANNTRYRSTARFAGFPGSTDPTVPDTDGDGLSDEQEILGSITLPNGTTKTFTPTDPNVADTDRDDLTDADEVLEHGTDPTKQDSDGDTYVDGDEIDSGTNPNSADSKPGGGLPGPVGKDVDLAYLALSSVALLVVAFLCIAGILWRWG